MGEKHDHFRELKSRLLFQGTDCRFIAMQSPKPTQLAFVSYAREDAEFVLRLAKDLRAGGANVWIDQLDIGPGERWDRAVDDALAKCPQLLAILSPLHWSPPT